MVGLRGGGAGGNPIVGGVFVTFVLMILPSLAARCVILKVSVSCPSDAFVVVNPRGVVTALSIGSGSSVFWMSTVA